MHNFQLIFCIPSLKKCKHEFQKQITEKKNIDSKTVKFYILINGIFFFFNLGYFN